MKRIISLFLTFIMIVSLSVPAFSDEISEKYYTIPVEYSDNTGYRESLKVMVQNNNVFVNAKMLAERLGYTFGENGENVVILNKNISNGLPVSITKFEYNSTDVSHMLFNHMINTYEAPFACVKNSEGSWIPLEYSLLLMNSGMMVSDNALLIDIPNKKIIDYFFDVAKNSMRYNFDWADDFGYTETDIMVLGGSSHLINVFNGVLGIDGASWASLFQQFAGSTASYDQKYGKDLAMFFCTESDKELEACIRKVKLLNDLLNVDGDLGKFLSFTSEIMEFEVGTLYRQCEAALEGIKNGNSSVVNYNRSYQALERALDRQTWFSHTGEYILDIQKNLADTAGKAFSFFDAATKIVEVVGYAQEFQNQDEFSLAALEYYLDTAEGGLDLPEDMKKSMRDHIDALSGSMGGYMKKQFLDNIDQWLTDAVKNEVPLHRILGSQAAAVLIVWDIASNAIPFIANGLSSADSFELALYSLVFQGDTYLNYLDKRDAVFSNAEKITAENIYEVAQYCYIYLKSCYITREAAVASLVNKSDSMKEKIKPLIEYQNNINTEIAEIIVELKGANKTNSGGVFGFLPTDNEEYLDKYDDTQLIRWINAVKQSADSGNIDLFSELPEEFYFASGAGGWRTILHLSADGTFWGEYLDSNLGSSGEGYSSTENICSFNGRFSNPQKIEERLYSAELENLILDEEPGTSYIDNEVLYTYSTPYGLENTTEVNIYLPRCPIDRIPADEYEWLSRSYGLADVVELPAGTYIICSINEAHPFIGRNYEMSIDNGSEKMDEGEIYNKLVAHYQKEMIDGLMVLEGSIQEDGQYHTDVRCGVPGNPTASQRLYDVVVDPLTGEVTQSNVMFDEVITFSLNTEE